jgi:endonuclease III-like uncharacterized protein
MPNLEPDAPDSPWEDLVISILAVNQYSLERTYVLLGPLRENKITDPARLARWQEQEIEEKLRASGCDRGAFMTKLFAERLSALGALIRNKGIAECEKAISSKDARVIEAFLMPVKGIGPKVLRNFYSLREIKVSK